MRRLALPVLLSLRLLVPTAALAGESSRPPTPPVAKRVWSSEEVEALRARGLISLVGQESPAEEPTAEQVPREETPLPLAPRPIRAKDPEWYHEQAEKLRDAIEANTAQIQLVLRQLRDAHFWEAGINLNSGNLGITPESTIQLLDARNQAELEKIDALWDQARRNEIPPGALR